MRYGSTCAAGGNVALLSVMLDELGRLFLAGIETNSLSCVDIKLLYAPVNMPDDAWRKDYLKRPRYTRKDRTMIFGPALDFDRFVRGDHARVTRGDCSECRTVVIDGFATARDMVKRAGLTAENLKDFDDTVARLRGQVPDPDALLSHLTPEGQARARPLIMPDGDAIAGTGAAEPRPG